MKKVISFALLLLGIGILAWLLLDQSGYFTHGDAGSSDQAAYQ